MISTFFFFNDTATTEIYTLSLHDALPIYERAPTWPENLRGVLIGLNQASSASHLLRATTCAVFYRLGEKTPQDRKSTRLNSSHGYISYAVFCLKKKKTPLHNSSP